MQVIGEEYYRMPGSVWHATPEQEKTDAKLEKLKVEQAFNEHLIKTWAQGKRITH